jgi:cyclophilin family peptidyl-prolyl cis-trans isomerase
VAEIGKRPFDRGIVGYAYRGGQKPTDADSQIFILRIANPALNGKYAAVGRVTKGMAVVDKIQIEDMIKDVVVK